MSDHLFSLSSVGPRLGISRSEVYALVRAGLLPTVVLRAGGRLHMRESDLDQYIASLRPDPAPRRSNFRRKIDK